MANEDSEPPPYDPGGNSTPFGGPAMTTPAPGAAPTAGGEPAPYDPGMHRPLSMARSPLRTPFRQVPSDTRAGAVWEISPEMGGIVDDIDRAAPARVIAQASLLPNIKDRIPVYSKALGIPETEFATMGDHVVHRDPTDPNKYVRVEPSVVGATGPKDLFKRIGSYASSLVGQAIPAAAGVTAGALTRGNVPAIMAAAGAGGVGDTVRQAAGRWLSGGNPTDIDWQNVAGQTALAGVGQGASVAGRAFFDRVPPGLAAADRNWFRNPANVAGARENADLLTREGITGTSGAVTNRGSLISADRQMMRNAETSDPMREVVRRVNTEEVPTAARRAADRIYPEEGADQAARNFREAAGTVVESPRQETNQAAREAFRLAQAEPDQWNAAMRRILGNEEMQGLYRSAATRAERDVTLRTPGAVSLPELTTVNGRNPPPFQAWQYMRQELDARAQTARLARDFNTERQLGRLSDMLDGAIREVNPAYVEAQAISAPGQQITTRLNRGTVGSVAKTNEDAPASEIFGKAFDPSRTSVASIAESRQAFANANQIDAWDSAFSSHVRNVADRAQRSLASGDTGNVAGKIHAELFGDVTKRDAVAAALGGKDTPAYKQFAETMRAMEIAARIPAVGSTTATDLGQIGAASSPVANAGAAALRLLNVVRWPAQFERAANFLQTNSASKAAQATAQRYLSGPALNAGALEGIRVMSPQTYGLLGAITRLGTDGFSDLVTGKKPSDWQPYQPPPSR